MPPCRYTWLRYRDGVKKQLHESFSDFLSELGGIEDWLRDAGAKPNAERFQSHLRCLQAVATAEDRGGILAYMRSLGGADRAALIWALAELTELGDVRAAFPVIDSAAIRKKLQVALSGPGSQREEDSNTNLARNTMFELSLAARIRRGGLEIEFGQDNPDLIVTVPSGRICIQCKRPFATKSIVENISRATNQLRKDLKHHKAGVGVIAISLSRAVSERGEFHIISDEVGLPALTTAAQREVQVLTPPTMNISERLISGLLFHMLYPVVAQNTGSVFAAQFMVHRRLPGRTSQPFEELLERLPE